MTQRVVAGLLLALLAATASADDTLWTRRYTNGTFDQGRGAAAVGTDVYVVVKTLVGTVDFTSVVKYRSGGDTAWARRLNLDTAEMVFGLAALPDSGVVVGAVVPGQVPFTKLARVNKDGDTVWTRRLAATTGTGLAADDSGRIFVWGSAQGLSPIDSVRLVRYNEAGAVQASRSWKFGRMNQSAGCATDNAGSVVCTGIAVDSGQRPLVVKFNANCDTTWTRFPPQLIGSQPTAAAFGPAGEVYVAAAAGQNGKLVKLNASGSPEWMRGLTAALATDGYHSIARNRDSCVFVAAVSSDSQFCTLLKYSESGVELAHNFVPIQSTMSGVTVDAANRPVVTGVTSGGAPQCLTVKFTGMTGVAEGGCRTPAPPAMPTLASGRQASYSLPGSGMVGVSVFDVTGRVVLRNAAASRTGTLDLTGFSAGVYLVKFEATGYEAVRKLVIE